jgi:hypothetical protein
MHTDALRRLSILSQQLGVEGVGKDSRLVQNQCKSSNDANASKLVTPEHAVNLVPDDCWITVSCNAHKHQSGASPEPLVQHDVVGV